MASAASQAYTVHRRSLAYIEQMSFRLRTVGWQGPSSSIAKVWSVKKSMLDHSKSMRFGAVHSRGADVFFLILLWVEKIVFETGLHMAIKLQLRILRRNVVRRRRKVGRGPCGGRFTFRKSEHQARHSQFARWLSRWPAGLVRDRSGPSSIRCERSNKTKLPKA